MNTINITKMNEVQTFEKKFVANVTIGGAKKFDHITPIIKQLKKNINLDICTATFKILIGNSPIQFNTFFTVHDATNT